MKNKWPRRVTGPFVRDMWFLESDPGETRTHGQWLKRPLLYQLSYRIPKDFAIKFGGKITN